MGEGGEARRRGDGASRVVEGERAGEDIGKRGSEERRGRSGKVAGIADANHYG